MKMRFALVIPALNEEEAIAATLRRALAARRLVLEKTPVTDMVVVFVNDGSTDATQQIVDGPEFQEVVKVRFPHNRGYGAAIKAGWKAVDAELVGFMDADGTCDPNFAVPLLERLLESGADVVIAGRMNPLSKMPRVRKLGNAFFARLLALFSGRRLSDSASGFRIVRRSSLRRIAPLPDRLHFTPAMSSICLMDDRLRIEEVPMRYEERIGRSKLSVVRDGLRFLDTMLLAGVVYRPARILGSLALLLLLLGATVLGLQVRAGRPGAGLPLGVAALLVSLLTLGTVRRIRAQEELLRTEAPGCGTGRLAPPRAGNGQRFALLGVLLTLLALATVALREPFLSPVLPASALDPPALAGAALLVLGGGLLLLGVLRRVTTTNAARLHALLHDEYAVDSPDRLHSTSAASPR